MVRFTADSLTPSSLLQLSALAGSRLTLLCADAFTALGSPEQHEDLLAMGRDFIAYLTAIAEPHRPQECEARLAECRYRTLAGFMISTAAQTQCGAAGPIITNRAARVRTASLNGPVVRGLGGRDGDLVIAFWRLSAEQWRSLAMRFGWDPEDLSTASAPGITIFPQADPEMSLLAPVSWM